MKKILENFIIFTACISALLIASNLYILIPIGDVLVNDFGFTSSELSLCSSVFSLFYAAGILVWGLLGKRFGNRVNVSFGMTLLAIVTILFSFLMKKNNFIFFRILQGVCAASFAPAILSYFSSRFEGIKRILSIALLSTTFFISSSVGQIISQTIVTHYGITILFLILGIAYLFAAFCFFVLLKKDQNLEPAIGFLPQIALYPKLLKDKALFPFYRVALILLFTLVGITTLLNTMFMENSFSDREILNIRLITTVGLCISPLAPFLARKFGLRKVISFSLGLSLISLIFLSLFFVFIPVAIFLTLFNIGIALITPLVVSEIGRISGDNRNMGVSLYTFILFSGASAGSFISIQLMALLPGKAVIQFFNAVMIISLLLFNKKAAGSRAQITVESSPRK